jgi:AraC-like DNA-binding protein
MSTIYREFAPSPRFAPHVECFWSHVSDSPIPRFRVLPDGCADIIFERPARSYGGLAIVGTMTTAHAFHIPARQFTFGVRFRPAMGARFLRVAAREVVDASIPLADTWSGPTARRLLEQLGESRSPRESIARLEAALGEPPPVDSFEKAIAWLVENHGRVRLDDLARSAGIGPRQFRRICLERTGLTPKRLARILRFRHALSHAGPARTRDWADVALECGYYDQAHLINDFREFTGTPPGEFFIAPPPGVSHPLAE